MMRIGVNGIGIQRGAGLGGVAGVSFYGLSFDGGDEAIISHAADLNAGTGDLTVSFWMRTSNVTDAVVTKIDLDAFGDGWRFFISSGGEMGFAVVQGGVLKQTGNTAAVNDGVWHFIMGIVDQTADEIRLYVDGVIDGTPTAITDASITNAVDMYFGRFAGTDKRFYTGDLMQVRLAAGVARTVAQGVVDMNSPRVVGWETNYWQMQPGTGTTVTNEVNAANSAAFGGGAAAPDWIGAFRTITSGGPQ